MIRLLECVGREDAWGRAQGRVAFPRLLEVVEAHPGVSVFPIFFKGIKMLDTSFASETIVELARRFRKEKGFCIVDLDDEDIVENIDLAAAKKMQPMTVWRGGKAGLIGQKPSEGVRDALYFALDRVEVRSTEYVEYRPNVSIANASMKFKSLWNEGFLLRKESTSASGGIEHVYRRIG